MPVPVIAWTLSFSTDVLAAESPQPEEGPNEAESPSPGCTFCASDRIE